MIVSHLMHLRTIAGLGGILLVAIMAAVMLAGPAAAHCPSHHHCDGGDKDTGGGEAATFEITISGDLGGNVTTTNANINGKESLIHNNPEIGENLELDMGVFLGNNATSSGWDLTKCFAGSDFKFTGSAVQVVADKNDTGFGSAGFWFTAKGDDGTTDIKYQLAVTLVTIDPADGWPYWLPAVNATSTVTGGPWEMRHSNGPGKKIACTGEGTGETEGPLDFAIVITRIS